MTESQPTKNMNTKNPEYPMNQQIADTLTGITYHRNETKRKIEIAALELHRLKALDDALSQAGAMIIELGGESVPKRIDPSDTNPGEMRMVGARLANMIQEQIERKIKCGYVITEQALHEALNRVRKNALSADLALDSEKPIGSPQEASPQNAEPSHRC